MKRAAFLLALAAVTSAIAAEAPRTVRLSQLLAQNPRSLRDMIVTYQGKPAVLAESTTSGSEVEIAEVGVDFFCANWIRKAEGDAETAPSRVRCYPFSTIRSIIVKDDTHQGVLPMIKVEQL